MERIRYVQGDATCPQTKGPKIIAHVCNDLGGWGKGFVLAVSRRWPEPEAAYRRWHRERARNDFGLGAVQLVQVRADLWVANMIGQRGIRTGRWTASNPSSPRNSRTGASPSPSTTRPDSGGRLPAGAAPLRRKR